MNLISWNVNGIRACLKKGFMDFFKECKADIFCIQETKMQVINENKLSVDINKKEDNEIKEILNLEVFKNYYSFWNSAEKKRIFWNCSF